MTFNESNTVESFICDLLCGGITHHTEVGPGFIRHHGQISGLGWHYLAPQDLPHVTRRPLLVSVAGAGPRSQIRDALATMGFRETRDYFCTA